MSCEKVAGLYLLHRFALKMQILFYKTKSIVQKVTSSLQLLSLNKPRIKLIKWVLQLLLIVFSAQTCK